MNSRKRAAAGFTLLELLLVLVLVGIGTGLAIASVDRLSARMQERQWLDRTQQQLKRLRNKAVLGGQPITGVLDFDRGTLAGPGMAALTLPPGYHWRSVPEAELDEGATLELRFLPDGTLRRDTAFALLTPSGQRQEFHLRALSGRIERLQVAAATP